MASQEIPGVVNELLAAMRANDPEAVARLYTADCAIADPAMQIVGTDGLREALDYFFGAFEITAMDIEQTIVEGDRLALRSSWTVLHRGEYLGVPPSGREFRTWNVMLLEIRDGRISSDTSVWDAGELLRLQAQADRKPEERCIT